MAQDFSNLGKKQLLELNEKQADRIRQLESRKKYGLVWEDKTEDVVVQCQTELPVLKNVESCTIKTHTDHPSNILIEGDNYHALSVLNFTHHKKIDIIYIDPPYNTGAKDWKYNNNFVDINDTYRHSKWLSMMNNRLRLAKDLLKVDGALICAIDHNEQERLGLLLQELFPSHEITCVTIVHNPSGIQGKNFSYNHEFAYFVYPSGDKKIALENRSDEGVDIRPLRDVSKGNHLREDAANCFYPIFVRDGKVTGFGDVSKPSFHPKSANVRRKDGIIEVYPIDPKGHERKWVFARQSVERISGELAAEFSKKRGIWDIIRTKRAFNYKTVWTDKKYNANAYGTQLLGNILDTKFPYPKSLYTVAECIKAIIHNKEEATILDFFAGSGTTGHAVLELNKEDGGRRSFILCTNNEGKICESITYERVRRIINGYKGKDGKKVAGLNGNLNYFKTAFVKKSASKDETKLRVTQACTEMLCLREGVFEKVKKTDNFRIFRQGDHVLAIYYALELDQLATLKNELDKMRGQKVLYCFTLDSFGLDKNDFDEWDDVRVEPIPQKILDVYEEIYEHKS